MADAGWQADVRRLRPHCRARARRAVLPAAACAGAFVLQQSRRLCRRRRADAAWRGLDPLSQARAFRDKRRPGGDGRRHWRGDGGRRGDLPPARDDERAAGDHARTRRPGVGRHCGAVARARLRAVRGNADGRACARRLRFGARRRKVAPSGAALVRLDGRRADWLYSYASLGFGALTLGQTLLGLLLSENPYISGTWVEGGGLFNSLILGYLLPAFAAFILARRSRGRPPEWRRWAAAGVAIALLFASVNLELRRLVPGGPEIGQNQPTSESEFYAYSALWLALGILFLAYGVLTQSKA